MFCRLFNQSPTYSHDRGVWIAEATVKYFEKFATLTMPDLRNHIL